MALPKRPLRSLHLFAGIGGGILGDLLLGHVPVCAVEIDSLCRDILLARQRDGALPRFPIWDDVRTFDGAGWKDRVDIVAGGFPCQDVSVAGKRRGLAGKRSGLWFEMRRIIREIHPRYVFIENVKGLLTQGLDIVLEDLAALGYDAWWGVLGADKVGATHRRDRVWILGTHTNKPHGAGEGRSEGKNPGDKHWVSEEIQQDRVSRARKIERGKSELASDGLVLRSSTYADALRAAYGVPSGMDRLRALGNAQVPAVVALAWEALSIYAPTE